MLCVPEGADFSSRGRFGRITGDPARRDIPARKPSFEPKTSSTIKSSPRPHLKLTLESKSLMRAFHMAADYDGVMDVVMMGQHEV